MQNELLKKYFLGLLDPADNEQVELRMLEDDSFEEELTEAENDLIEDYLDVKLTNDEIIAFNKNYLNSNERKKQVEFIRSLQSYAKNIPTIEKKPNLIDQIKAIFSQPGFTVGFAAIILIIFLGLGYLLLKDPENKEIVSLNNQDLSNLEQYKNLTTLNLVSDNLRSTNQINLLPQQELTEKVLLRLILPAPIKSEKTFSVSILRDGKVFQTLSQHSYQNQEIRLLLPKTILTKGEYRISVSSDSEKYNFYFATK